MLLKLAATAHTDTTWMQQVHTMGMEGRYFTQKRSIRFHTTWYVTHFKYACFIGFPLKWASWSYGKCCGTVKHHLPSPGGFPAHNHAATWMSMTFCLFPALLMGFIPALCSFFNWVSHFHLIKRTRCINTRLHKLGEKWINVWEVCRQYKQSKSNKKRDEKPILSFKAMLWTQTLWRLYQCQWVFAIWTEWHSMRSRQCADSWPYHFPSALQEQEMLPLPIIQW